MISNKSQRPSEKRWIYNEIKLHKKQLIKMSFVKRF